MGDRPQIELYGALQSLYHTRDYSDLTILTSDKIRHPVHRAIVCPRSHLLAELVRHQPPESFQHGDLLLEDDDPETVRLMLEYLYLLDYVPLALSRGDSSASHGHSSDGSSTRTEPLAFGNVYGTSAISAFGGPQHHGSVDLQSPFSAVFPNSARDRAESTLTIHAIPRHDLSAYAGGAAPDRRKRTPTRVRPPEPSPLATREPNLTLHARMYAIAVKYGIAGLVALALDKFKIQLTRHWDSSEFAESIHVVYTSTHSSNRDMRTAVADALDWHASLLDKPEIEVAIMEINGLAYELLKRTRRAEPEFD